MSKISLNPNLLKKDVEREPIRAGFGRGLVTAGRQDHRVVALCADLTESTKMDGFAKEFPDRFFEIGVAEQNLVTVSAGLALGGKIPFCSSYAAFSPGRNWEQIRTTICLNQTNVKIVGSHAGVSVGPDGATHQMLEDVAIMRTLPNMRVVVPCDSIEAEKATISIAMNEGASYLRLAREGTPIVTTKDTVFKLGKAEIFRSGRDLTMVACGPMVYHALVAAEHLHKSGIDAEVINAAVVKPLDWVTILASAKRTGAVMTLEEGQINGGLGGAVAELLGEHMPLPLERIGMVDRFGESGAPDELMEHFKLTAPHIAKRAHELVRRKGKHD